MVLAGPASREEWKQMHDLLTQPKSIEVTRLHDHLVMWQFARNRLAKYDLAEPEAAMLFDTSKMACQSLMEKDGEFKFLVQPFIKDHNSVNGLVNKKTISDLYDMVSREVSSK